MQKLSSRAYLLRPSPDTLKTPNGSRTDDPALIIIFGWMNAADGPLAKYVAQYQVLFPASSILLVTCTFAGMTIPWLGLREARTVATATRAILDPDVRLAAVRLLGGTGDPLARTRLEALLAAFARHPASTVCIPTRMHNSRSTTWFSPAVDSVVSGALGGLLAPINR